MKVMINLLTLAIAETSHKNEYKVVVYNLDNDDFLALKIPESNFKDYSGQANWDIFGVTRVRGVKFYNGTSEFYDYKGTPKVISYYSKGDAKKLLNKIKVDNFEEINNEKRYGIVKVRRILRINEPFKKKNSKDKKLKHKIDFTISTSNGLIFFNKNNNKYARLNKDYRWLAYWRKIYEKKNRKLLNEKINYWENFLNKSEREVFLVYYHHVFFGSGDTMKWIVGFHCL
jgi:hypothetical protein